MRSAMREPWPRLATASAHRPATEFCCALLESTNCLAGHLTNAGGEIGVRAA